MRKTLSIEVSDEEDLDLDELIANQILQKGQQENISQFALLQLLNQKPLNFLEP